MFVFEPTETKQTKKNKKPNKKKNKKPNKNRNKKQTNKKTNKKKKKQKVPNSEPIKYWFVSSLEISPANQGSRLYWNWNGICKTNTKKEQTGMNLK